MRFRYTDIQNHQDPQKPYRRPYLIVRLINGDRHKDVISLVDSGADVCLFHSDIGRMLGIEIEAAPTLPFQGVSGAKEVAYLHRVDLVVKGLSAITLDVGFTNSMLWAQACLVSVASSSSFTLTLSLARWALRLSRQTYESKNDHLRLKKESRNMPTDN